MLFRISSPYEKDMIMNALKSLVFTASAVAILAAGPVTYFAPADMAHAETKKSQQETKKGPLHRDTKEGPRQKTWTKTFKPDLQIVMSYPQIGQPGAPSTGHCGPAGNGSGGASKWVNIKVKNFGNATSGPNKFKIKFIFDDADPAEKTVQEYHAILQPGQSGVAIGAVIPASAWQSSVARYTLIVDPDKEVQESNEANNVAKGFCSAPAG